MLHEKNGHNGNQGSVHGVQARLVLGHVALACVGRLLFARPEVQPVGAEQVYLFNHVQPLREVEDLDRLTADLLRHPAQDDHVIVRLARDLDLSHAEVMTLVLAQMVEEEPMVGRMLAHIQAPVGGSRPALGMLEAALGPFQGHEGWVTGTLLSGPALATGALQLVNLQAPLPEQMVRVPLGLALVLRSKKLVWPGCRDIAEADTVRLPQSALAEAVRQAGVLGRDDRSVLVVRSASQGEARAVAAEVALHLGREALLIADSGSEMTGLGLACALSRRLPVFEVELGAEGEHVVADLPGFDGPRLVLTGPDGLVRTSRGSLQQWSLTPPPEHERRELWQSYLKQDELARQLASEHIHSSGRIAELAQLADRGARLRQREQPDIHDLRRAAWEAEAGRLGTLAQPITAEIPDEALVLSRTVSLELEQLCARCRARERLDESLGITIRARYQQGVRCLMIGPSGTGKTLAAGWLATRLGLPLYRVDLAAVVSKYIGETEKNLATLLARAEHSEIVLLFDEADSLFGKRTEVKDSNDRFANSQTNYLLQRIEFYRGIVVLTSNSRERFDAAFTRRLDKIIEFPLPNPQERRALWHNHLGLEHGLSMKQINQLAGACDLAGGHIRNAVLTAAVEAHAARRAMTFQDVLVGLVGEYRKLGRQFPTELKRSKRG